MGSNNILHVVGAGPGTRELLTWQARRIIDSCHYFTGGRRLLKLAPDNAETHVISADLDAIRAFIAEKLKKGDVCVLASGDPGCYSIMPFLMEYFKDDIRVTPGISSMQLLAARLGIPWQDWTLISLHGRDAFIDTVSRVMPTLFFCDKDNSPQDLARQLLEKMNDCAAAVGSDLGMDGENIFQGTLAQTAHGTYPGNSLLLVLPSGNTQKAREQAQPDIDATAPGIADDLWLRREGIPLSKSEVRAVLLSKARPKDRRVIWDIGAGTGSYGIECSLLEPGAMVFSIDKNPQACALVSENAVRFGAKVQTVNASAPDALADIPRPDLVIIGGNDGRLDEIFRAVLDALNPGGRIVVTALLEKTKAAAHKAFAGSGLLNRQATRVSIARGESQHWVEYNPVIIFTGDKDTS
ncbi:MAG: precorrin-6y C5,15-methyltransferase (decarboxylating) subunit CbiE [Thermoleophilia bacterium]|jgi:precorrin-6Y C5,15-methyltransferase (decarboxylating)